MRKTKPTHVSKCPEGYDDSKYPHPSVTSDIIVLSLDDDNELNVLLIKRKNDPDAGMWAIPGGFLEVGKESTYGAAARELYEETGIKLSDKIDLRQLLTASEPDRDPRGHIISVIHTVIIPKGMLKFKAGDDAADAKLFKIKPDKDSFYGLKFVNSDIILHEEDLALDHAEFMHEAVERLRGRLNYTKDSFMFLANKNKFTVGELQKVHEAIMFKKFDRANFRKMFSRNFVNTNRVSIVDNPIAAISTLPKTYKLKV